MTIQNRVLMEQLFEYEATVTQLSGTSEIATIGFLFVVPEGERVNIVDYKLTQDDITPSKSVRASIFSTAGTEFRRFNNTALDNSWVNKQLIIIYNNAAQPVPEGLQDPTIMGGGMSMQLLARDTIDATKTFKVIVYYFARHQPMTVTVVGSGISISAETHKNI